MATILRAKPVNVQVRWRSLFVPPTYDLYKVEVSAALAATLANTYRLKSTELLVNQNAASSQYLSFRYILQGEPLRHMDVLLGLDQVEIIFSNPATIQELMSEFGRVCSVIMNGLKPMVKGSYFEANVHCEAEKPGARAFLSDMVRVGSDDPAMRKGFSLNTQFGDNSAKLHMEISESVQDGLYVVFAFLSRSDFPNVASFSNWFLSTLEGYRRLQKVASVQLLERNADGSFSANN